MHIDDVLPRSRSGFEGSNAARRGTESAWGKEGVVLRIGEKRNECRFNALARYSRDILLAFRSRKVKSNVKRCASAYPQKSVAAALKTAP